MHEKSFITTAFFPLETLNELSNIQNKALKTAGEQDL